MEWYWYILLPIGGAAAGFINTLAGSGSVLTLPLLALAGLTGDVANATNRVGVLLQCTAGAAGFRRHGVLPVRASLWLAVPAAVGAVGGAFVATWMRPADMDLAIAVVMACLFVVLLVKPGRFLSPREGMAPQRRPGLGMLAIFLGIGFYMGFIQAGVGILLLAALAMGAGWDLVRANAIKLIVVLAAQVVALAVFIPAGKVDWAPGLLLAVGQMPGAWIAARVGAKRGVGFIRWVLLVAVLAGAAKFAYNAMR